jgi:hypothetical protein
MPAATAEPLPTLTSPPAAAAAADPLLLVLVLVLVLLRSDATTAVLGVVGQVPGVARQDCGIVPSMAAWRCCCSKGVSRLHFDTREGRNSQMATPSSTAGAPSMMNSHRQPAHTPAPHSSTSSKPL